MSCLFLPIAVKHHITLSWQAALHDEPQLKYLLASWLMYDLRFAGLASC
jgi:hypothetical protein